ncbi:hypothetical protein [Clostridium cellulovorans]|uniref:hypothetical protein n=1 Tax=Clostridium cellulovorans TaxID=1493 RepID=UPI0001E8EE9B|nr:hypothetical protein [Clostridium cellulovorans]
MGLFTLVPLLLLFIYFLFRFNKTQQTKSAVYFSIVVSGLAVCFGLFSLLPTIL